MTWVYNNNVAAPIEDTASFKDSSGTNYPSNWSKGAVVGMVQVVETSKPTDALNRVTGSHVELLSGVPTRVWDTTPYSLSELKINKLAALNDTLATKLALGWTYGGKVYQVGDTHIRNMERFISALNYYVDEIALWFTATAYVAGDLVRVGKIFYRCAENHTSGVWATDLAAVKWTVWYFHPHKGGDGKWRALDNSMNVLTLAQTKAMCEGAIDYAMKCQANYVAHKDGINACADVSAVNAYDLTANWPTKS